tara:strand:+ start:148 stop:576 length:429 start_codon:yes stop_codon:yes gene_type:complete
MTKKLSTLAQLKLDVINYHNHDMSNPDNKTGGLVVNDKFLIGLARDACYTSHNSLNFKRKQIADSLAEYDIAAKEENVYAMERTERWIERLTPELDELVDRHNADKEVYGVFSGGETWLPNRKPAPAKAKPNNFSNLRKRVA